MKERILIKHDTAENWKKAINFIPLPGELVIYDGIIEDGEYLELPKLKIGDGIHNVNDLPFLDLGKATKSKNYEKNGVLIIDD